MKNLANLLKIEFIFIKRNLTNFIMGLGFPVIFFIVFSGMQQFDDPETKVRVVKDMLISMTAFSSISFALFSLPISIKEAKYWLEDFELALDRIELDPAIKKFFSQKINSLTMQMINTI